MQVTASSCFTLQSPHCTPFPCLDGTSDATSHTLSATPAPAATGMANSLLAPTPARPSRNTSHPAPAARPPAVPGMADGFLPPAAVRSWVLGFTRELVFVNKPAGAKVQVGASPEGGDSCCELWAPAAPPCRHGAFRSTPTPEQAGRQGWRCRWVGSRPQRSTP